MFLRKKINPGLNVIIHLRITGFVLSCRQSNLYRWLGRRRFDYKKCTEDRWIEESHCPGGDADADGGGGGRDADGDARRHFQKKPLKVTILGVAPANFVL